MLFMCFLHLKKDKSTMNLLKIYLKLNNTGSSKSQIKWNKLKCLNLLIALFYINYTLLKTFRYKQLLHMERRRIHTSNTDMLKTNQNAT